MKKAGNFLFWSMTEPIVIVSGSQNYLYPSKTLFRDNLYISFSKNLPSHTISRSSGMSISSYRVFKKTPVKEMSDFLTPIDWSKNTHFTLKIVLITKFSCKMGVFWLMGLKDGVFQVWSMQEPLVTFLGLKNPSSP